TSRSTAATAGSNPSRLASRMSPPRAAVARPTSFDVPAGCPIPEVPMSEKRVPLPQFRTILFAADLSARSHEAFRVACSLASEGATRLVVVHVKEEFPIVEPLVGFGEVGGVAASPGDAAARDEAIFE